MTVEMNNRENQMIFQLCHLFHLDLIRNLISFLWCNKLDEFATNEKKTIGQRTYHNRIKGSVLCAERMKNAQISIGMLERFKCIPFSSFLLL